MKMKNWFLRRQIRRAKRRVHEVSNNLYILRHTHPGLETRINGLLDEELYPILESLDSLQRVGEQVARIEG